MISAADLWTACIAGLIVLFGACALLALWAAISFPLAVLVGRMTRDHQREDEAAGGAS